MPASTQTDKFSQLEAEADRLREAFEANQITAAQLEQGMKELMVQDDQGVWWTVGSKSGEWFRYTGSEWVRGIPPKPVSPVPSVQPTPTVSVSPPPQTSEPLPKPRRRLASVVFLVGLVLTWISGGIAGSIYQDYVWDASEGVMWLIAFIFGIISFALTLITSRKLWRGNRYPSPVLATFVSLFGGVGFLCTGWNFVHEFSSASDVGFIVLIYVLVGIGFLLPFIAGSKLWQGKW